MRWLLLYQLKSYRITTVIELKQVLFTYLNTRKGIHGRIQIERFCRQSFYTTGRTKVMNLIEIERIVGFTAHAFQMGFARNSNFHSFYLDSYLIRNGCVPVLL
ncbi:MAG: hypothetical protein DBX40_01850 [Clostridiales bacterium]|nr:MAG: hypothetical protein DBX40_01850 [Clostridiales bacterium]